MFGNGFVDVILEEFLKFVGKFADAFGAEVVAPFDDLDSLFLPGILFDPGGHFIIGGTFRGFGLEFARIDSGELEEDLVEGAVEMVFAGGPGKGGAAFVERPAGEDVAGQRLAGAAGEFPAEVGREHFEVVIHRRVQGWAGWQMCQRQIGRSNSRHLAFPQVGKDFDGHAGWGAR
jgi:hypothetical protein